MRVHIGDNKRVIKQDKKLSILIYLGILKISWSIKLILSYAFLAKDKIKNIAY